MCAKDLKIGHVCTVRHMDMTHRASKKLVEMGIVPNCEFSVENIAPMGDPCLIKVRGYHLAVRRRDLEALDMTLNPSAEN